MRFVTELSWLALVVAIGVAAYAHLDELARATALEVVEERCR